MVDVTQVYAVAEWLDAIGLLIDGVQVGQPFWANVFGGSEQEQNDQRLFDFLLVISDLRNPLRDQLGRRQGQDLRQADWRETYYRPSLDPADARINPYGFVHFIRGTKRAYEHTKLHANKDRDISRMDDEKPMRGGLVDLVDPASFDLISGTYSVGIRRRPGRNFEEQSRDHFAWVGFDPNRVARKYQSMAPLNAYRIILPDFTLAQIRGIESALLLIRLDPNVEYVEQDTVPRADIGQGPPAGGQVLPDDGAPSAQIRKRQQIAHLLLPWHAKMLTISRHFQAQVDLAPTNGVGKKQGCNLTVG
ncbi:MAG: hypothetical protein Q9160_001552 [Pyrenula sp. 1 TL-2023]